MTPTELDRFVDIGEVSDVVLRDAAHRALIAHWRWRASAKPATAKANPDARPLGGPFTRAEFGISVARAFGLIGRSGPKVWNAPLEETDATLFYRHRHALRAHAVDTKAGGLLMLDSFFFRVIDSGVDVAEIPVDERDIQFIIEWLRVSLGFARERLRKLQLNNQSAVNQAGLAVIELLELEGEIRGHVHPLSQYTLKGLRAEQVALEYLRRLEQLLPGASAETLAQTARLGSKNEDEAALAAGAAVLAEVVDAIQRSEPAIDSRTIVRWIRECSDETAALYALEVAIRQT